MNSQSLSISLSTAGSVTGHWVRLEQESMDPDGVTKAQAAELVDSLFEVVPCTDPSAYQGGLNLDIVPSTNETIDKARAVESRASEVLQLPLCGQSGDQFGINLESGDYTTNVMIFLSHVCRDFELKADNGVTSAKRQDGVLSGATRIVEDIDVTVQVNGFTTTLDMPIGNPCRIGDRYNYIFKTDVAVDRIEGSTVYFSEYVTVFRVQYTTVYYSAPVRVLGLGGKCMDCNVFCFFSGIVAELELQPPAEDGVPPCLTINFGGTGHDDPDDDGGGALPPWDGESPRCYQTTTIKERCICNNKNHGQYDIKTEVNCPDDETAGAGGVGDHLTRLAYVDCGIVDEYGTFEFYEKACCHAGEPPVRCKEQYSVWLGGAGDSSALDKYKNADGSVKPRTSLIPVSPKNGICGVLVVSQKVTGSCCDEAEPLELVSMSSDTISPGHSVYIRVQGDLGPLAWSVNGGYRLATERTGTPGGNSVFMSPDGACGDCTVIIKGQCDSLSVTIPLADEHANVHILQENIIASPEAYISVSAAGGMLPYEWSSGNLTLIDSGGNWATFLAPADFCGMSEIMVSDSCNNSDEVPVKSTVGHWEQVFDYNPCDPPGSGYDLESAQLGFAVSSDGEYRAYILNITAGSWSSEGCDRGEMSCPVGHNKIAASIWPEAYCASYGDDPGQYTTFNAGCCVIVRDSGAEDLFLPFSQVAVELYHWECP